MPAGDRTGPQGMGPMTGRGQGYCSGSGRPGFASLIPGRNWFNFGHGAGRGRGRSMGRRGFNSFPSFPRW
ncbi:MAG: DUF5320 domain-containing protein [Dehalococcoidales bacterium]|nr:DUF5320 domain-containing protein [Dehalococcoidales bacterium]